MSTGHSTLRNGAWIKHPSANPNSPYTYTPEQLQLYLIEIGFISPNVSAEDVKEKVKPTYKNLVKILRAHLCRFAFENSEMHYSPTHEVDVTPQGVFKKLVEEKNGGSLCFGTNGLLYAVLRGLGYRTYSGAGRVNFSTTSRPTYGPLAHMVLFVQPFVDYTLDGEPIQDPSQANNQTYLLDTGFGSPGLARPILLVEDENDGEGVLGVNRTERHRLRRGTGDGDNIVSSLGPSPEEGSNYSAQVEVELGHWVVQVWHEKEGEVGSNSADAQKEWRIVFTFSETEYFLQDYVKSSTATCHTKEGVFWNHILGCRFAFPGPGDLSASTPVTTGKPLVDDDEYDDGAELIRITYFFNELRRQVGGNKSEVIKKVESEKDRVEVLREAFGARYDLDEAVENVKGRKPAFA
ncbi:cysteine proteinase [Pluteus cervinus]|uniref:Cysteine proteinase n=1 Tax=Pluteus cervinus TaxID=181527 RepID=A0ACD3ALV3_9AGAR|nr:cysteine proteinase [Pluteus cervinus]